MNRRTETLQDAIATLVQAGYAQQQTADETATEIMQLLEQDAELRNHDPRSEL